MITLEFNSNQSGHFYRLYVNFNDIGKPVKAIYTKEELNPDGVVLPQIKVNYTTLLKWVKRYSDVLEDRVPKFPTSHRSKTDLDIHELSKFLGDRLKDIRVSKAITFDYVALTAFPERKDPKKFLQSVENGSHLMKFPDLVTIAKVLEVSLDTILGKYKPIYFEYRPIPKRRPRISYAGV